MGEIREVLMDIAASLWMKPCDFEEIRKRDFMKGKSEYGVSILLSLAEEKKYIYERKGKYYCYKKTVIKILNPNDYELPIS